MRLIALFMAFVMLGTNYQSGDPAYTKVSEREALVGKYKVERVDAIKDAISAARHTFFSEGQAAGEAAVHRLINSAGSGYFLETENPDDQQLRRYVANTQGNEWLTKMRMSVDAEVDKQRKIMENRARTIVVAGTAAVLSAGALAGIGGVASAALAKIGVNVGSMTAGALTAAVPAGLGIYDTLRSASKAKEDAERDERNLVESQADITEAYARVRESRDLMRQYADLINVSALDPIAKSAKATFSAPSLPKFSLNIPGLVANARRRASEGNV